MARSKTGCLVCRRKRKKCDEVQPVCTLCSKTNSICEWPTFVAANSFIDKNIKSVKDFQSINNQQSVLQTGKKIDKPIVGNDLTFELYTDGNLNFNTTIRNRVVQLETKILNNQKILDTNDNASSDFNGNSPHDSGVYNTKLANSSSYNQSTTNFESGLSPKLSFKVLPTVDHECIRKVSKNTTIEEEPKISASLGKSIHEEQVNLRKKTTYESSTMKDESESQYQSKKHKAKSNDNLYQKEMEDENMERTYLHNTLHDFMFLNAASRGSSCAIEMPVGLDNVADANTYFEDFINGNSGISPSLSSENQPKAITGVSVTNLTELQDNGTPQSSLTVSKLYHSSDGKFINSGNLVDEIKLDSRDFELFRTFVEEIALWLDMFDNKKHFTTVFSTLSRNCLPLYYSILAIASHQRRRTKLTQEEDLTYHFYQRALYYLVPLVKSNFDIEVVASCIILCVLEMMTSSPLNWRRHLQGCATLLMASNIHGFSESLEKSLFWCFSRMDICNAIINKQPTLIPLRKWCDASLGEDNDNDNDQYMAAKYKERFLSSSTQDFDMYSNYIVFLAARAVNLTVEQMDTNLYEQLFTSLYEELLEWYMNRPIALKPVVSQSENDEFPKLLFSNGPGISGNQMYHMVMILMNSNKPRVLKRMKATSEKSLYKNHSSDAWHAKRIIGISLVNLRDHGCLTNAIQPIYIAGKVLTSKAEHKQIIDLLREIENITGWSCEYRINDLKNYWNDYL